MRNPVFTALLITALALAIIYAMYREDLKKTGRRRGFKTSFWLVISVSALIFVHYYALERSLRKSHASQGVRSVMASIHHSATTGGGYAVYSGADVESASADADGADAVRPKLSRPDNVATSPGIDDLELENVVLASVV